MNGILTLNPLVPEKDPTDLERPSYIEAPMGAGVGLGLANLLNYMNKKDTGDNNSPSQIDEKKPPQKEPPEEPNPLPKATETVLQAKEIIDEATKSKEREQEKNKLDDYFDGLEDLYDNEWYGSNRNMLDFFGNQDPDDIPYIYEQNIFQDYGMTKPIHELFENEYQGGVGDLGNADAAKVMAGQGFYTLGEFNAPEYYAEYQDKLIEYTREKLGDRFNGYRLTRKSEMDKLLNPTDNPEDEEFRAKSKSFSLDKPTALGFQYMWNDFFTKKDGSPRDDLVLIESPIDVESLIMRGKGNEKEVVVSGSYLYPNMMNFYDRKGKLLKAATEGPLAKTKKTPKIKKATGGFIDKPLIVDNYDFINGQF